MRRLGGPAREVAAEAGQEGDQEDEEHDEVLTLIAMVGTAAMTGRWISGSVERQCEAESCEPSCGPLGTSETPANRRRSRYARADGQRNARSQRAVGRPVSRSAVSRHPPR